MNARSDQIQAYGHTWFELENAVKLLRPLDFVSCYQPGKIANASEVLTFREESLTAPDVAVEPLQPHDHVVEDLAEHREFIITFHWNSMAEITLGQSFRARDESAEWPCDAAHDNQTQERCNC